MFEKLKKINIKGGCFEEETTLELFKNDPVSVIYGRNGSGKSTIARGIKEYGKTPNVFFQSLFSSNAAKDDDKLEVTGDDQILQKMKKQTFVFDEDFVNNNVKVKDEGVDSIVMLGEQVEQDDIILANTERIKWIDGTLKRLKEMYAQYDNAEDALSPQYQIKNIKEIVSHHRVLSEVRGSDDSARKNEGVTDEMVMELISMQEPAEDYETLQTEYSAKLALYRQSGDAVPVKVPVGKLPYPENLDELNDLLCRHVEKPELSEREQRLLQFLSEHPHEMTDQMIKENWEFCPVCLRKMDNRERNGVADTLSKLLNKEAEDYKTQIEEAAKVFDIFEIEGPDFPGDLYAKEQNALRIAISELREIIDRVRVDIQYRKNHIYDRIGQPFDQSLMKSYKTKIEKCNAALMTLRKCSETFNQSVAERKELKEQLVDLSIRLVRKELSTVCDLCKEMMGKKEECAEEIKTNEEKRKVLEQDILKAKQKMERTDIALDYINSELRYVFFSDKKVRLEQRQGSYRLKVNGRNVKPNRMSVGERNALGLCYFFAKLFGGESNKRKYEAERLIVIDDPVSSFDYGNRVGVMSLLRYQFGNIVKGNKNSRILVMSHDLHSVFDLVKIRSDIQGGRGGEKKFLELVNRQLKEQDVRNEYKKLLMHVYDYATASPQTDEDENVEMSIGNIMRRLMEAFASFCYNTGFENMMCRKGVLNGIPKEKRAYYENFMCRLTLNGLSHEEENVYSLDTMAPYFTREEKVQTAKTVLLFLMYVNEEHLRAYCEKSAGMFETIKSWQGKEETWLKG